MWLQLSEREIDWKTNDARVGEIRVSALPLSMRDSDSWSAESSVFRNPSIYIGRFCGNAEKLDVFVDPFLKGARVMAGVANVWHYA